MNAKEAFEKTNQANQGSLVDAKKAISRMADAGYYELNYTKDLSAADLKELRNEGYEVEVEAPSSSYKYHYTISWLRPKSK